MDVAKLVVYVYNGEGAGERSLNMLCRALEKNLDKHQVKLISPEDIINGSWTKDAAALAIGGGYDMGFVRALGYTGAQVIRKYVHQGGSYLGICAGGYFGCDAIEFNKSGPLEVCGKRNLKFFPGLCIGPLYPKFVYDSEEGARAVVLQYKLSKKGKQTENVFVHNYYNGGGYFVQRKQENTSTDFSMHNRVDVLGYYSEHPENLTAIVKCKVHRGQAVLTGPHPEFDSHLLDSSDVHLKKFIHNLHADQRLQHKCFKSILQHLGLSTYDLDKNSDVNCNSN